MKKRDQRDSAFKAGKGLLRLNYGLGLGLFGIVALTAVILFVSATEVSNRSDIMSNQAASQLSSHTIGFTLSGGNTFSAGESIVVDFN